MPAGFQHPQDLGKSFILVGNQVQYAVTDHHIKGVLREGDLFDIPFDKFHIAVTHLAVVPVGFVKHLVGEVESGHMSFSAHNGPSHKAIVPGTRTQVEHTVPYFDPGIFGGDPTTEL